MYLIIAVVKVGIKPESLSMSFVKYIKCIIYEQIKKTSIREFKNCLGL